MRHTVGIENEATLSKRVANDDAIDGNGSPANMHTVHTLCFVENSLSTSARLKTTQTTISRE